MTPEEAKALIDSIVDPAELFPAPYDKILPEIAKPVKDTIDLIDPMNRPNMTPELREILDPKETPKTEDAEKVKSPLVIDLDGNGIATYALKNGVYFDIDSDGFAEKMGWLTEKDAFLAIDKNGNGIIDDASELFGDLTAANGFEALKAMDSNSDGVIDANDAGWEDLMLWQDAINDGVSQDKELVSVADAGIERIELNYTNQDITDENGNQHLQTATVYWKDGHTTVIEDIWFQHNNAQTIDLTALDFGVIANCFNDRIISNDDYFFQAA